MRRKISLLQTKQLTDTKSKQTPNAIGPQTSEED